MTPESMEPAAGWNRKWVWIAAVAAFAILLIVALFSQRPPKTGGVPGEMSVAQAAAMRNRGSFLLDVRQPEEWAESHVPGSTLIPLGELEARVGEVPRDQEIVVLCRSGNRSKRGRDILLEAGFDRATSMAGGIVAWKAEGHPTVSGS